MSSDAYNPLPIDTWQTQLLRMVAFTQQSALDTQQNWWQELTGHEAESVVRKKTEYAETGVHNEIQLVESIDPLRVQWLAAMPLNLENMMGATPTLGSFTSKAAWFRETMVRWLTRCPQVKRLAFHSLLFQRVRNHDEGYSTLDRYLPHVRVFNDSSDFLYRINRRKNSRLGIPELKINKLSTWSVPLLAKEMTTDVSGTRGVIREEEFFVAVDLDINTNPEVALPYERLPEVFGELIELAIDIASRGDVREGNENA